MRNHEIQEKDQSIEVARRRVDEEVGIGRRPPGFSKYVVPFIAVLWSFFQLSIASWLILDSTFIRAIHLGFALLIVFLNFPFFKKTRFGLRYFSDRDRIPVLDYLIGIIAAFVATYIVIDYAGLITRYGAPITRDIIIGLILIVLLLEATRRVIGPALPVIASIFLLYSFLGPYMPDLIAFKGTSLNRLMGQMTMSTEGIYDMVGAPFVIRQNPQVDAQFSNAYTVAVALINKSIRLGDFQESVVINNTQVHELAKKIKSYPDDSLNWDDPNSYKSIVRVKCSNGREFVEKVRVVKGYPEDPVTTEDVIDKFNDCILFARKQVTKKTIDQLTNLVLHLEEVEDIRQICDLYA
jgi:hypothetical protein